MQKPTWAVVIGILMIFFGGCGISNDIQQIYTTELSEFGNDFFEEISIEASKDTLTEREKEMFGLEGDEGPSTIFDAAKHMTDLPEDSLKVVVRHGYIGLAISLLFILAGLFFLLSKKHVIKIAIATLIASILFVFLQAYEMSSIEMPDIFRWGLNINLYCGLALDVLMLLVILIMDKAYYSDEPSGGDYYDELDAESL